MKNICKRSYFLIFIFIIFNLISCRENNVSSQDLLQHWEKWNDEWSITLDQTALPVSRIEANKTIFRFLNFTFTNPVYVVDSVYLRIEYPNYVRTCKLKVTSTYLDGIMKSEYNDSTIYLQNIYAVRSR